MGITVVNVGRNLISLAHVTRACHDLAPDWRGPTAATPHTAS